MPAKQPRHMRHPSGDALLSIIKTSVFVTAVVIVVVASAFIVLLVYPQHKRQREWRQEQIAKREAWEASWVPPDNAATMDDAAFHRRFHELLYDGYVGAVPAWLALDRTDPNSNGTYPPPLMVAIRYGRTPDNLKKAELLLRAGADPNVIVYPLAAMVVDDAKLDPAGYAALRKAHLAPGERTPLTPLMGAVARYGAPNAVRLLLDYGASATGPPAFCIASPIHSWADDYVPSHPERVAEAAECLQLLIDAGASPRQRDSFGRTPLLAAVEERNVENVRELLRHDASAELLQMRGDFDESSNRPHGGSAPPPMTPWEKAREEHEQWSNYARLEGRSNISLEHAEEVAELIADAMRDAGLPLVPPPLVSDE